MKTKQPVDFMVFGAITCDGDVISPFIFPHGFYVKCLENIILPWIKRVAGGKHYVW